MIFSLPLVVFGVCTPEDGTTCGASQRTTCDLYKALDACTAETPDGSCPKFAAATNGIGYGGNGGVNGKIGEWDTSKITNMNALFYSYNNYCTAVPKS